MSDKLPSRGASPITILPWPQQPLSHPVAPAEFHRQKRARVQRACDNCKKRKTRCDEQRPCLSCQSLDVECTYLHTRKKKDRPNGYVQALEDRLKRMEVLIEELAQKEGGVEEADDGTGSSEESDDSSRGELYESESSEGERDELRQRGESDTVAHTNLDLKIESLSLDDYDTVRFSGPSSGIYFFQKALAGSNPHTFPYPFEEPEVFNSNTIHKTINTNSDDEQSIVTIKVEAIPEPNCSLSLAEADISNELSDKLVNIYFEVIHPTMPLINKRQFLRQYRGEVRPPPPPLLINAMFSAAARIVSKEELGEHNRGVGRVFYKRAEKLLDSEYRKPKLSTCQALLLLTLYYDSDLSDEGGSSHIYAGMAIRMAQDIGLHRSSLKWKIPDSEKETRRRVWWASYIIDRWNSAKNGTPLSINDNDCDVELPTEYDDEDEISHPLAFQSSSLSTSPKVVGKCSNGARCFIEWIKLSYILAAVLRTLFRPTKTTHFNLAEIITSVEKALSAWEAALPSELRYNVNDTSAGVEKWPYAGPLMMMACSIRILLHRRLIGSNQYGAQSLVSCLSDANKIISIAEGIPTKSFLCFSWTISVNILFQASTIVVYQSRLNKNPETVESGRQALDKAFRVLDRNELSCAECAKAIIKRLMNLFGGSADSGEMDSKAGKKGSKIRRKGGETEAAVAKASDETGAKITSKPNILTTNLQSDLPASSTKTAVREVPTVKGSETLPFQSNPQGMAFYNSYSPRIPSLEEIPAVETQLPPSMFMFFNGAPSIDQQVPPAGFAVEGQQQLLVDTPSFPAMNNPVAFPPSFNNLLGDKQVELSWNISNGMLDWNAWDSYIDEMQTQYDLEGENLVS